MTVMFLASLKGSCRSGFFCAGLGELFFSGIDFVVWDWATAVVARRTTQKSRSSFMTLPFCSNVDTFDTGCLGRADNWAERQDREPQAPMRGVPIFKLPQGPSKSYETRTRFKNNCNFTYSALACFKMGTSGSASF